MKVNEEIRGDKSMNFLLLEKLIGQSSDCIFRSRSY
jgi:hypothetical protein